jgi:integrase
LVSDLSGEDFDQLRASLAKKLGPVALGNRIQRVRSVFKYGFDEGLMDRPVRFGASFKKPNRKTMRRARQSGGIRMFEAADLRKLLNAAGVQLKAMILLGINCGFGQTDVAHLTTTAVDLDGGWIDYPRPKTAVQRRCPLWPESVMALRESLAKRPAPHDPADAGLVFVTKYGRRWLRVYDSKKPGKIVVADSVRLEFSKLIRELNLEQEGRGFYALRHGFRTIADASKDQPAIDHIMGHARDDMASLYRERIDDARLRAVADYVRAWLFAGTSVDTTNENGQNN